MCRKVVHEVVHFEEAEKEKKIGEKMTIEALKAGFRKNLEMGTIFLFV